MTRPTLNDARAALSASFGYDDFRPGQEAAIASVLSGQDTLVVLPTGGGKSVCFQVPALVLPGLTVVVSPLISLMKDQVDALEARNLPAAYINSTLTSSQTADRLARAARGEIRILYLAPERFDFGNVTQKLAAIGVGLLAVDEAHCISQWGHDFRPSYLRVTQARLSLGSPPTIALTATATPEVREDICVQLALKKPRTIITGFDRVNLAYHVLPARNEYQKDKLLADTLKEHEGLAIVYATTRNSVEQIASALTQQGLTAAAYHAGLDDKERQDVQESFMAERLRVIVATNAFGMGIDKPNVRLVVHYSMPGTLEAYYQEAGRAGRDGNHSDVFLLHSFPDRFTHEFFIKSAYPEKRIVEKVYAALARRGRDGKPLPESIDDLLPLIGGGFGPREVESALRILTRAGAIASTATSRSLISVRLLATPERIRSEITGEANPELGLLRTMWRMAGDRLSTGATIDIDALPPGLAERSQATSHLNSLQSRQILVWERLGGGLHVASAGAPLSSFSIDWPSIDRRRKAELSKLDSMQLYAYTKYCRRGLVLRYFGDPAARSKCNGCDNCLGISRERGPSAGAARGKPSRGAKEGDLNEKNRGAAAGAQVSETVLDREGQRLLERLKKRRSEIARRDKVPAFIVFSDRTLAEIAQRRPASLAALRTVRGVGAMKLDLYGEQILAVVKNSNETEAA